MPIRGPVAVKLYKKEETETLHVGPMTIRIYEDGSLTENRVSGVLLQVPAGKSGPPMHWHRFHDELFLVTKGSDPMHMIERNTDWRGRNNAIRHPRRRR